MTSARIISLGGAAALVLGLAAGLAIGGRGRNDSVSPRSSTPGLAPARERTIPDAHPVPSVLPPGAPSTAAAPALQPDVQRTAQELWDLFSSGADGRAAQNQRNARVKDLRPEMASFFASRFRELEPNQFGNRQWAMELAIACGGPGAVAFVRELCESPAEGYEEYFSRLVAADCISRGHLVRSPKDFPVDGALLQRAEILLISPRSSDRYMAIAVLGRAEASRTLSAISQRFLADPDPVVREGCLRQLGRIGDAATLDLLKSQGTLIAEQVFANYVKPEPVRGGPPVRYSEKTYFLSTLKDAIEQLEERFAPK